MRDLSGRPCVRILLGNGRFAGDRVVVRVIDDLRVPPPENRLQHRGASVPIAFVMSPTLMSSDAPSDPALEIARLSNRRGLSKARVQRWCRS